MWRYVLVRSFIFPVWFYSGYRILVYIGVGELVRRRAGILSESIHFSPVGVGFDLFFFLSGSFFNALQAFTKVGLSGRHASMHSRCRYTQ